MIREYIDLRIEEIKTKLAEGLTDAFSTLCSVLLIIGLLILFLSVLCFALILLIGKILDNYALGAFVVCALVALILVIALLRQNKLFKTSFHKRFKNIFFADGSTMRSSAEIEADIKVMEKMIPQFAMTEIFKKVRGFVEIFRPSQKTEGSVTPQEQPGTSPEQ